MTVVAIVTGKQALRSTERGRGTGRFHGSTDLRTCEQNQFFFHFDGFRDLSLSVSFSVFEGRRVGSSSKRTCNNSCSSHQQPENLRVSGLNSRNSYRSTHLTPYYSSGGLFTGCQDDAVAGVTKDDIGQQEHAPPDEAV